MNLCFDDVIKKMIDFALLLVVYLVGLDSKVSKKKKKKLGTPGELLLCTAQAVLSFAASSCSSFGTGSMSFRTGSMFTRYGKSVSNGAFFFPSKIKVFETPKKHDTRL